MKQIAAALKNECEIRLAQAGSRFHQRIKRGLQVEGRAADDLEHLGGGGLLLSRLRQFAGKKGDLLLQLGNGGAASARGRWRVVALLPRRLAVTCLWFTAHSAPSHLALPWPTTIPYHIMGSVVHHSKFGWRLAAQGRVVKVCRLGIAATI